MSNLALANRAIDLALAFGAREFVVCGGSRNAPLVVALERRRPAVDLVTHFEERSAAFFALGRARRTGSPVAVVTTSGTASAELLPAAIEAYYSGAPLILITADRPRRHRGTGAPQAIEQQNLFGVYAEVAIDAESVEDLEPASWSRRRPLHLNVSFDEPLLGEESDGARSILEPTSPLALPRIDAAAKIDEFLAGSRSPLVVIGGLRASERDAAAAIASSIGAPVYAEPLSGLRESMALAPLLLRSGERILGRGAFDRVLRLGAVPTLRFWRDLDESRRDLPVLSVSSLPFPGLGRGELLVTELSSISGVKPVDANREILEADRSIAGAVSALFDRHPTAEPPMLRRLSTLIPPGSFVFLGNSLPIREWDLAARRDIAWDTAGNRGANGIDGNLSTFLGMCTPDAENWCVVGDLTALYDMAAPWVLPQIGASVVVRFVVVNNGGGRIFSRVPSLRKVDDRRREVLFENAHSLDFSNWAAMWELSHHRWSTIPEAAPADRHCVIEIRPDAAETDAFWRALDELRERA